MIVFHEQVIRTLAALAGYTETYADHVRRHLDDDDLLPALRADFLAATVERGVDRAAAEQIWHAVAQFASFGFCKAHAAAFAVPTYQSAWLKTHYPAHFLAGPPDPRPRHVPAAADPRGRATPRHRDPAARRERQRTGLRGGGGGTGRRGRRAVVSARRSLRSSTPGRDPPPDRHLSHSAIRGRLALKDVHGISDAEIRSILQARAERPFRDVGDFMRRDRRQPAGHRGARACGGVRRARERRTGGTASTRR